MGCWREGDLVYCTRCGAKNDDDAEVCVKCGAPLQVSQPPKRYRSSDNCFGPRERHWEDECFGLPHKGAIAGVIFGIIIVIIGIGIFFEKVVDWRLIGSFVVIAIGVLIIAGALHGMRRRP